MDPSPYLHTFHFLFFKSTPSLLLTASHLCCSERLLSLATSSYHFVSQWTAPTHLFLPTFLLIFLSQSNLSDHRVNTTKLARFLFLVRPLHHLNRLNLPNSIHISVKLLDLYLSEDSFSQIKVLILAFFLSKLASHFDQLRMYS